MAPGDIADLCKSVLNSSDSEIFVARSNVSSKCCKTIRPYEIIITDRKLRVNLIESDDTLEPPVFMI